MSFTSGQAVPANCGAVRSGNYNGIDLIKFICAIMVFTVHIAPFQEGAFPLAGVLNYGLQNHICRLAVPFFFVCSGFFLFGKAEWNALPLDTLRSYCFRILRLIGTWKLILVVGGTGHLWYLGATVVAVALLWLLLHWGMKPAALWLVAAGLYLIGLLGDAYYGIIEPLRSISWVNALMKGYEFLYRYTRNGVFMGFIFVLLGASIAHSKKKLRPGVALIGFLGSMLCMFAEVFLLRRLDIPQDYNMYVFLVPSAFFLFSFARGLELKDRPIYKQLRTVGVLAYFVHLIVDKLVKFGLLYLGNALGHSLGALQYIVTFLTTFAVAIGFARLANREKYRWLQFLYT